MRRSPTTTSGRHHQRNPDHAPVIANSGTSDSDSTPQPPRGGRSASVSARLEEKKPAKRIVRTMRPICWAPSPATITPCGTAIDGSAGACHRQNHGRGKRPDGAERRSDGENQDPGGQHRPRRPASTRHVGRRRLRSRLSRSIGLSACGSPIRRRFSHAQRALHPCRPIARRRRAHPSIFVPAARRRCRRRHAYRMLAQTQPRHAFPCRGQDRLFFRRVCLYIHRAGFVRLWR